MLECQPTSGLEIGGLYTFTLGGAFNISNQDFVAQLDRMVLDTFAPKIQAKDGDPKSISLACLGIGYCNMLIFANLQDNSEPPFDRHELSPIFAELAIMRINGLVSDTMNLVRNDQHGLGADSRPFLDLWFLYLSAMPKLGRLQLFVSSITLHSILSSYLRSRTMRSYLNTSKKIWLYFERS
jgi:hypothetical protein